MSNPSFLCVPYRYKASTLYSQVPSSVLGDFNVIRTTSPVVGQSTRVNAAGLIETVGDNVPRLDYPLGGISAGCPALLVEPSAQNTCLQSSDFNTTWIALNSATVNTNTAISPDGTQNADTINLASVIDSRVSQSITVANSTTYTISCFYKNIALTAGELFNMRFNNFGSAPNDFIATATINLAAGTANYTVTGTPTTGYSGVATGRIENYGNGWYRVSLTFTVGSAGGNTGGFQPAQVGSATARSFYAWGAQLEASSVPTSYIPTAASPVTRSEDRITKTGITSLIGQTEGTFYFEGEAEFAGTDLPMINRSIQSSIVITKNTANRLVGYVYYNTNVFIAWTTPAPVIGPFKAAVAYRQGSPGDSAFFVNGVQVGTTNTTNWAFTGALNDLIVRSEGWAGGPKPYRVRALGVYPTRIPNTAPLGVLSLQSLTQ